MKSTEYVIQKLFLLAAFCSASVIILILGFMLFLSTPVFKGDILLKIFSGTWSPAHGYFGIFPMITGTVVIAFISLLIAFPLSFGCSLLIEIIKPKTPGKILKKIVLFMTGIPTVIYGFVGIFLLVPMIRSFFFYGSGMCILSASIMLSLLISPTMILFFSNGFASVPQSYINAVDALGGNETQKFFLVILPNSWKTIVSGLLLSFGRAMGDTLIALMIAGNSVAFPKTVLDSARTLTSHIALIMAADFESIEFKTLFICGITLYAITVVGIFCSRYLNKQNNSWNF